MGKAEWIGHPRNGRLYGDTGSRGIIMERFEYEVTMHSGEAFTQVVYFCSTEGDCGVAEVPQEEPQALVNLLNERGEAGWELIQLVFGGDGVMACWKRRVRSGG
jgi:hypothetical protein